MSLESGYIIIWLDTYIGSKNNCQEMKKEFEVGLEEIAAVPSMSHVPNDDLICAIRKHSTPILFTNSQEEALQFIENNMRFKKVIFISSATLGRPIVPKIIDKKLQVESYYIFCGNMAVHRNWGNECINDGLDIQMFDHETTLLIRLCRDMSNILKEDGKVLLNASKPEPALKYFEFALVLADTAVKYDTLTGPNDTHRPSTEYRPMLLSLIEKARKAMK